MVPGSQKVGRLTVTVVPALEMVTVSEPGMLVPVELKSFSAPKDGSLAECVKSAEVWARGNQ